MDLNLPQEALGVFSGFVGEEHLNRLNSFGDSVLNLENLACTPLADQTDNLVRADHLPDAEPNQGVRKSGNARFNERR